MTANSVLPLLSIVSATDHLSQLVLSGEVGLQRVEFSDQIAGASEDCFFRGDLSIGLNTKLEFGKERVRDLA
jgi:hypothetical protein